MLPTTIQGNKTCCPLLEEGEKTCCPLPEEGEKTFCLPPIRGKTCFPHLRGDVLPTPKKGAKTRCTLPKGENVTGPNLDVITTAFFVSFLLFPFVMLSIIL